VTVTLGAIRIQIRSFVLSNARINVPRMIERGALRDCLADPAHFSYVGPGPATTWGYDLEGHSANDAAPPLDAKDVALAKSLAAGGIDVHLHGPWGGGVHLARVGDGSCVTLGSFFPASGPVEALFKGAGFVGLFVSAVGAIFTWWLAVRPLVRQVGILRVKAALVGHDAEMLPANANGSDDISVLGVELDRAHQRIRADAKTLQARQHDLRRHLENVSHDLKLPISSLQLSLEQAANEADASPLMAELITSAIRDVVYLGGLTTNLRMAAVLEGGWSPRLDPQTNLSDIVERATARVRLLARRRGVELEVALPDEPVIVTADPLAAEQAIANVVENAVSHGATGGHVSVLVTRDSTHFELTVMDDGPGVPPSALPLLGRRTFRTDDARQRDGRGQGLGLAITRELCSHFRWSLEFTRLNPTGLSVAIRGPLSNQKDM